MTGRDHTLALGVFERFLSVWVGLCVRTRPWFGGVKSGSAAEGAR